MLRGGGSLLRLAGKRRANQGGGTTLTSKRPCLPGLHGGAPKERLASESEGDGDRTGGAWAGPASTSTHVNHGHSPRQPHESLPEPALPSSPSHADECPGIPVTHSCTAIPIWQSGGAACPDGSHQREDDVGNTLPGPSCHGAVSPGDTPDYGACMFGTGSGCVRDDGNAAARPGGRDVDRWVNPAPTAGVLCGGGVLESGPGRELCRDGSRHADERGEERDAAIGTSKFGNGVASVEMDLGGGAVTPGETCLGSSHATPGPEAAVQPAGVRTARSRKQESSPLAATADDPVTVLCLSSSIPCPGKASPPPLSSSSHLPPPLSSPLHGATEASPLPPSSPCPPSWPPPPALPPPPSSVLSHAGAAASPLLLAPSSMPSLPPQPSLLWPPRIGPTRMAMECPICGKGVLVALNSSEDCATNIINGHIDACLVATRLKSLKKQPTILDAMRRKPPPLLPRLLLPPAGTPRSPMLPPVAPPSPASCQKDGPGLLPVLSLATPPARSIIAQVSGNGGPSPSADSNHAGMDKSVSRALLVCRGGDSLEVPGIDVALVAGADGMADHRADCAATAAGECILATTVAVGLTATIANDANAHDPALVKAMASSSHVASSHGAEASRMEDSMAPPDGPRRVITSPKRRAEGPPSKRSRLSLRRAPREHALEEVPAVNSDPLGKELQVDASAAHIPVGGGHWKGCRGGGCSSRDRDGLDVQGMSGSARAEQNGSVTRGKVDVQGMAEGAAPPQCALRDGPATKAEPVTRLGGDGAHFDDEGVRNMTSALVANTRATMPGVVTGHRLTPCASTAGDDVKGCPPAASQVTYVLTPALVTRIAGIRHYVASQKAAAAARKRSALGDDGDGWGELGVCAVAADKVARERVVVGAVVVARRQPGNERDRNAVQVLLPAATTPCPAAPGCRWDEPPQEPAGPDCHPRCPLAASCPRLVPVGHLPAVIAAHLAPMMDAGETGHVQGTIIEAPTKGPVQIRLHATATSDPRRIILDNSITGIKSPASAQPGGRVPNSLVASNGPDGNKISNAPPQALLDGGMTDGLMPFEKPQTSANATNLAAPTPARWCELVAVALGDLSTHVNASTSGEGEPGQWGLREWRQMLAHVAVHDAHLWDSRERAWLRQLAGEEWKEGPGEAADFGNHGLHLGGEDGGETAHARGGRADRDAGHQTACGAGGFTARGVVGSRGSGGGVDDGVDGRDSSGSCGGGDGRGNGGGGVDASGGGSTSCEASPVSCARNEQPTLAPLPQAPSLPQAAVLLFWRLALRKGPWFRVSDLISRYAPKPGGQRPEEEPVAGPEFQEEVAGAQPQMAAEVIKHNREVAGIPASMLARTAAAAPAPTPARTAASVSAPTKTPPAAAAAAAAMLFAPAEAPAAKCAAEDMGFETVYGNNRDLGPPAVGNACCGSGEATVHSAGAVTAHPDPCINAGDGPSSTARRGHSPEGPAVSILDAIEWLCRAGLLLTAGAPATSDDRAPSQARCAWVCPPLAGTDEPGPRSEALGEEACGVDRQVGDPMGCALPTLSSTLGLSPELGAGKCTHNGGGRHDARAGQAWGAPPAGNEGGLCVAGAARLPEAPTAAASTAVSMAMSTASSTAASTAASTTASTTPSTGAAAAAAAASTTPSAGAAAASLTAAASTTARGSGGHPPVWQLCGSALAHTLPERLALLGVDDIRSILAAVQPALPASARKMQRGARSGSKVGAGSFVPASGSSRDSSGTGKVGGVGDGRGGSISNSKNGSTSSTGKGVAGVLGEGQEGQEGPEGEKGKEEETGGGTVGAAARKNSATARPSLHMARPCAAPAMGKEALIRAICQLASPGASCERRGGSVPQCDRADVSQGGPAPLSGASRAMEGRDHFGSGGFVKKGGNEGASKGENKGEKKGEKVTAGVVMSRGGVTEGRFNGEATGAAGNTPLRSSTSLWSSMDGSTTRTPTTSRLFPLFRGRRGKGDGGDPEDDADLKGCTPGTGKEGPGLGPGGGVGPWQGVGPSVAERAEQAWYALAGDCVCIPHEAAVMVRRAQRLYFCCEDCDVRQQLAVFPLVRMGLRRFPSYRLIRSRPVHASRDDLVEYEKALELAQEVEALLTDNDMEAIASAVESRVMPQLDTLVAKRKRQTLAEEWQTLADKRQTLADKRQTLAIGHGQEGGQNPFAGRTPAGSAQSFKTADCNQTCQTKPAATCVAGNPKTSLGISSSRTPHRLSARPTGITSTCQATLPSTCVAAALDPNTAALDGADFARGCQQQEEDLVTEAWPHWAWAEADPREPVTEASRGDRGSAQLTGGGDAPKHSRGVGPTSTSTGRQGTAFASNRTSTPSHDAGINASAAGSASLSTRSGLPSTGLAPKKTGLAVHSTGFGNPSSACAPEDTAICSYKAAGMPSRTKVPTSPDAASVFLDAFTAEYVLATVATVGVSALEKVKRFADATSLLRRLLELGLNAVTRRRAGQWWLRLSLDLEHLGRKEESLAVAEAAINLGGGDKELAGGPLSGCPAMRERRLRAGIRGCDLLALQRRAVRLAKPPRRWKRASYADAVLQSLAPSTTVTIRGRPNNREVGVKSRFYGYDDQVVTVEELGLQYYASDQGGAWQGVHDEGGVFQTLFGLLMWDALFADVPDVFRHPYQSAPMDLRSADAFYCSRAGLIETILADVAAGEAPRMLQAAWDAHYGTLCVGVSWERHTLRELQIIAKCAGGPALASICRLLAVDHQEWRGGMPDLLLWRVRGKRKVETVGLAGASHPPPPEVQCPPQEPICSVPQEPGPVDSGGKASGIMGAGRCVQVGDSSPCSEAGGVTSRNSRNGDSRVVEGTDAFANSRQLQLVLPLKDLEGEMKLVEVKGPRDRLSEQQRCWLRVLEMEIGMRVEVLKVVEEERLLLEGSHTDVWVAEDD